MQRNELRYDENLNSSARVTPLAMARMQNAFINRVYGWMCAGLAITAIISFGVASQPALMNMMIANPIIFFGLITAELILVGFFAVRIEKMSASTATMTFLFYAVLNGVVLSMVFYNFTAQSLATTFFATAGTFGVMSLYGYVTKRDLTSLGNLCFMFLFGVIIASVINIFVDNNMFQTVITYVGIAVFVGLTAYDTQKIKAMSLSNESRDNDEIACKLAVSGALSLYLDFINLFLLLLRIFGGSRD